MKLVWAGVVFFLLMTLVASGMATATYRPGPSGGVVLIGIPGIVIWGVYAMAMATPTLLVVVAMSVAAWRRTRHAFAVGLVSTVVVVGSWGLFQYLRVATDPRRDSDRFEEAIHAGLEMLALGMWMLPAYLLAFLLLRWTRVAASLLDPY